MRCRVGADGEGAPTVEEEVPKARSASPLGVVAVAAGPDEGGAGAATTLESRLHVWDAAGVGTELALPPSEAWGLAFCPDGVVAVASGSAGGVSLWRPPSTAGGELESAGTLRLPGKLAVGAAGGMAGDGARFALSVAAAPGPGAAGDGLLAVGASDGMVGVFDRGVGALLHTLAGHTGPVRAVAFSRGGSQVATACDDGFVRLFDARQAELVAALEGHQGWALSVDWGLDDLVALSGGADAGVRLWDLRTRTSAQVLEQHSDSVWGVAFSPDGQVAASVSEDKSLALYSVS